MRKLFRMMLNPYLLISYLKMQYFSNKKLLNRKQEIEYVKSHFYYKLGYKLNLNNPRTFNEKIQWLKLNDRNDEYTKYVDKLAVRDYIKMTIGEEYLIPLIGVYNSFYEIDFDNLPNSFVIKTTHDSGGVVVCKDKSNFNKILALKKINKSLQRNYFDYSREYPYKNILPKIIIEEYIGDEINSPDDYKILCFNGNPENIMICKDRDNGDPKFYFFDLEWNFLRYQKVDINQPKNFSLPMPKNLDEMMLLAKKLSSQFILSRIDFYNINGKIYFGEITLYPDSGFDDDITYQTDCFFGNKLNINR